MSDAVHICLGGNPSCSGINPCDACHHIYTTVILPRAMVAGGFNGSRTQASAFFHGYGVARQEILSNIAAQIPSTLNGAEATETLTPSEDAWQEGAGQLTDEEVAHMAAAPPSDFAPEPDEDPGMPDEERAKEVAAALLKGEPLTFKATEPPPEETLPRPTGSEAGKTSKTVSRRSRGDAKKAGESTANKE